MCAKEPQSPLFTAYLIDNRGFTFGQLRVRFIPHHSTPKGDDRIYIYIYAILSTVFLVLSRRSPDRKSQSNIIAPIRVRVRVRVTRLGLRFENAFHALVNSIGSCYNIVRWVQEQSQTIVYVNVSRMLRCRMLRTWA